MSNATDNLQAAIQRAMLIRPKVGGFPFLAEVLRQAGVTRNVWSLPSCQSIYVTHDGPVVTQMPPLVNGMEDIPAFEQGALISALRTDQAGNSTFQEFLEASWNAGVVRYVWSSLSQAAANRQGNWFMSRRSRCTWATRI